MDIELLFQIIMLLYFIIGYFVISYLGKGIKFIDDNGLFLILVWPLLLLVFGISFFAYLIDCFYNYFKGE